MKFAAVSLLLVLLTAMAAFAQENGEMQEAPDSQPAVTSTESTEKSLVLGLIAFAAAVAIGLTALATGIAQSRIGAAGAGTIAERPESAGTIIIMLAIPETMVILGFIVAVIIIFTL